MIKRKVMGGSACAVGAIIAIVTSNGEVRTNQRGLELIGHAESCKREPYYCPAGILTDGIGNTHSVKTGTVKDDRQIAMEWQKNILDAESCVNRYANGGALSDNTFSAVTSIAFNIGCSKIRDSTLFKLARLNQPEKVCNEFSRWVYSGGNKMEGLIKRRQSEATLCREGLQ